jgi:hypothetical protein
MRLAASAFVVALLAAAAAHAQTPPGRVHGTIASVTTDTIVITTTAGANQSLPLAPDVRISSDKKVALADIKPGDYVGVEAQKQADGSLVAEYVTVFPAAAKGVAEGQHPGSTGPESSMTNASVTEVVTANTGNTLKLSYNGGTADIAVNADTPIVTPVPGDRSLLVVGMHVAAFVRADIAGNPEAAALTVEKDGVVPP